jgi:protease IV
MLVSTETVKPGVFRLIFGGMWSAFNGIRRFVFGVLALIILYILIKALMSGAKPFEAKSALVIPLKGNLVEQFSGSAQDLAIANALGEGNNELRIRDVKQALEYAAKDSQIDRVLLRVDGGFNAGQVGMREVSDALIAFRKNTSKEVIAYGNFYTQKSLFIAAAGDKIFLHPDGAALIEGIGRVRNYYKTMLDNLGVKINVYRVGTYKSFAEPYLLDGPSDASKEADGYWMNDLWDRQLSEFGAMRKIAPERIKEVLENLPTHLNEVGGDLAKLALREKMIDELMTPDQLREYMIKKGALATVDDDSGRVDYRKVKLDDYLAQKNLLNPINKKAAAVGVIVAEGGITDGVAPQGEIGGDSTAALVRRAREDKAIKALVLRVNSPGGSGFASEIIRREIELTMKAGKPVYVSMGDVAASGGYWISMASDGIYAAPSTITGSIGIFSIIPNAAEGLDKIGVHGGGTTTTWLAAAGEPAMEIDPRFHETMQSMINHGYQSFIGKVATARKSTSVEIDKVAQGRVWSGAQAKKLGLVDTLGGLEDAIKAAATKAKLPAGYAVRYIEDEPEGFAAALKAFSAKAVRASADAFDAQSLPAMVFGSRDVRAMKNDFAFLKQARENPFSTYAHCFCEIK